MQGCKLYSVVICLVISSVLTELSAQNAFEMITNNLYFSASNYCIYPDSIISDMTAPPAGKKPFYISHYGRHGSRYLSNRKGYDIPYHVLAKADTLGKLTPKGKEVLHEIKTIREDTEGRWGDLSGLGKQQQRNIARRMVERFPEVFQGNAHVQARSSIVNRCILSMGSVVQQLLAMNPNLRIDIDATKNGMWYLNHQDNYLRSQMTTPITQNAYDKFSALRGRNPRLMQVLFNDSVYVKEQIDEKWLNYYLLKTALVQQNTSLGRNSRLIDYFSYEEIHNFWQCENAWWYFTYGPSPLNGGVQPYTQRFLLRRIIEQADSCIKLPDPGVQLRFGHETVVLPLVCLLGINGFDIQIEDLELLEACGWWACLVFPMASNLQFVFYRQHPKDKDVLVKVLLNERETSLPLPDDLAPYYRWKDFRKYYLRKLDAYEKRSEGKP